VTKQAVINWRLASTSGWGILGLHLFYFLNRWRNIQTICGKTILREDIRGFSPIKVHEILESLRSSNASLSEFDSGKRSVSNYIVLDALGNDFTPVRPLKGILNIGRAVFENTAPRDSKSNLGNYDILLTGSNWNKEVIRELSGRDAVVINEGIDVDIFYPSYDSQRDDRFKIFSGGKVEYRKGQDCVMKVFSIFQRRHPEAVLVTAWQSHWPTISLGTRGAKDAPLKQQENGLLDILGWFEQNGCASSNVIDVGLVSNMELASIMRNCHVSLQLSRAEACTNLPVKEAMACGLPVISSVNTGMYDLLNESNAFQVKCKPTCKFRDWGTQGWGEPDLDQALDHLENVYTNYQQAKLVGNKAATFIRLQGRTWSDFSKKMETLLLNC
jgi:glycosyltransferase involved in cell wall biosynthesis